MGGGGGGQEWGLKVCAGWHLKHSFEMLVVVNTKGGNVPCSMSRTLFQYRRFFSFSCIRYICSVLWLWRPNIFYTNRPFIQTKAVNPLSETESFLIRVPEWLKGWSRPQTKECQSLVLPEPWCIQCRIFSND